MSFRVGGPSGDRYGLSEWLTGSRLRSAADYQMASLMIGEPSCIQSTHFFTLVFIHIVRWPHLRGRVNTWLSGKHFVLRLLYHHRRGIGHLSIQAADLPGAGEGYPQLCVVICIIAPASLSPNSPNKAAADSNLECMSKGSWPPSVSGLGVIPFIQLQTEECCVTAPSPQPVDCASTATPSI